MWRTVLADAGVATEALDVDHVRLSDGDVTGTFQVRTFRRPLLPSKVPASIDEPGLLIAPSASPGTLERAVDAGWSVVTDSGTLTLKLGARTISEAPQRGSDPGTPRRRGPVPWGTFTLVRRLLACSPVHQTDLARQVGMSQSRVSRVLAELSSENLVERDKGGWSPRSWDGLLDWWLAHYPGSGGTVGYWYAANDAITQVRDVLGVLTGAGIRVAVSGDVAADVLAPWRRPTKASFYAERGVSLEHAGFVPVTSEAEASLILCVPRDPGVLLPRDWSEHGIPLADPTQIFHDLHGSDAPEAADMLRASLRERYAPRWREAVMVAADV